MQNEKLRKLNRIDFSICMIVKNEASIIERCLKSIESIADEIIVVDTGSTDGTQNIAMRFGARVIQSSWKDDFAIARNESIIHANGRWILWLDADDVVPASSISLLTELKQRKADCVYAFIVQNQKQNDTGTEFMQARLFPAGMGIKFERAVHEQFMPSALKIGLKMVNCDVLIEHHGYADPNTVKIKAARNIKLMLNELQTCKSDPFTIIEVADSYLLMEDQKKAQDWYHKLLALPKINIAFPVLASQAHLGLGNILNFKKKYTMAQSHLKKAVTLCPERVDALFSLAVSMDLNGQLQLAADTLLKVMKNEHKVVQIGIDFRQAKIKSILRLGRILRDLNDFDGLKKLCLMVDEIASERPEIQNMIGQIMLFLNEPILALKSFEKSISICPTGNLDGFIGFCSICSKAGKREVLTNTITHVKDHFSTLPRFWAFCELINCNVFTPKNIDRDILENEKINIKATFLI